MEASRRQAHTPPPWEDPELRRQQREAQAEALRIIEAKLTPDQLERSDQLYAELLARAETWPE